MDNAGGGSDTGDGGSDERLGELGGLARATSHPGADRLELSTITSRS
jgi:hypothetical protein